MMLCFLSIALSPRSRAVVLSLLACSLLASCGSVPKPIRNLGKTDIDFVMDVHTRQQKEMMIRLTRKLYVRNPSQLDKNPEMTIDRRIEQIFGSPDETELPSLIFDELNGMTSIDAILLSFDETFEGDRVFAAAVGLAEMLRRSYNHQQEFFILDSLDEQALYNSARNLEVFVWRLYHRRDSNGELFLLSNRLSETDFDISFDRLLAKMATVQDMMALIVADKTDRGITKVVHGVAQFVFVPIP
ncbi:hypothetical protein KP803_18390 [Vibrio sp. ZSDE26]|uniref:Lipoprotein n=1 Tax=Vibrio amylolyticus TaxID=2847292 RepID=A0A9X1XMH1_9VIBR|nr:hypothetical protein [Vibrio amylolyticus]MCK6265241.1 hypothetical protein [Vibrio amylolyticus]